MIDNAKKKGFTLAEVLITLLIIGVVASLVIPSIINDTQQAEFDIMFKKNYASFANAARLMMMDNGGNLIGLFNNSSDMLNQFGEHILITKKCQAGSTECVYAGTNTWKNLYGGDGWFDHTIYITAILNNGASVMLCHNRKNCDLNYTANTPIEFTCGWMDIDINGKKGPNILGRDIFAVWITKTGIYPFGLPKTSYSNWETYCNKNNSSSDSGRACAAKVLSGGKVD
jgi:prepilin-type N-terminal cleavage/methylation domain-containing protein